MPSRRCCPCFPEISTAKQSLQGESTRQRLRLFFPRWSVPTRTVYTGLWVVGMSVEERPTLRQCGTGKSTLPRPAGVCCRTNARHVANPLPVEIADCPMFPRGETSGAGNPVGTELPPVGAFSRGFKYSRGKEFCRSAGDVICIKTKYHVLFCPAFDAPLPSSEG